MNVASLGEHLVKVMLVGRLDTPGVERVETRFVAHLVPDSNSAVIDLSQVDFVASMGAQQPVLQVFEAVALRKILPICASEAEALA